MPPPSPAPNVPPALVPYAEIARSGDPDLHRRLCEFYAGDPADHRFRLVQVRLADFHEIEPFDDYRTLRGGAEWSLVQTLRDSYCRGAAVDPIVFCKDDVSPRLLDGMHRASAAKGAGLQTLPAWELVGWAWRPPGG